MTIDERIEALTQSVELLSLMHQDNEKKNEERMARFETMFEKLVTVSEQLAGIARDHDRRLNNGGL